MGVNVLDILNSQSVENLEKDTTIDYKTINIPLIDILPNGDNFYSVDDVDELKASIKAIGLQQNLIVVKDKETSKYRLLSGHRRYKAISELGSFKSVPCRVLEISDIEEKLILIASNSTTRELTDYEKMEQIRKLKEIGVELKKKNDSLVPGRVRDFVAMYLNISSTKVGRLEAINNNLDTDLKEEYKKGNITTSVAYETSKLDNEKQKEVVKEIKKATNEGKTLKCNDIKKVSSRSKEVEDDNYVFENQISFKDNIEKENVSTLDTKVLEDKKEDVTKLIEKIKAKHDELVEIGEKVYLENLYQNYNNREIQKMLHNIAVMKNCYNLNISNTYYDIGSYSIICNLLLELYEIFDRIDIDKLTKCIISNEFRIKLNNLIEIFSREFEIDNKNVSTLDTKEASQVSESKDKILILEKVIKKYKNRLKNFGDRKEYTEENKLVIEALEHYIEQIK